MAPLPCAWLCDIFQRHKGYTTWPLEQCGRMWWMCSRSVIYHCPGHWPVLSPLQRPLHLNPPSSASAAQGSQISGSKPAAPVPCGEILENADSGLPFQKILTQQTWSKITGNLCCLENSSLDSNHILEASFHTSILLQVENRTSIHGWVSQLLKAHQYTTYFYL